MASRLDLHSDLVALGVVGAKQVYYQPPTSIKLTYPCIIYKKADITIRHADNQAYKLTNRYNITAISRDPDNTIADVILESFPYSRFDRRYTADNLYHDVLEIYY